jgi:hypothetical protein
MFRITMKLLISCLLIRLGNTVRAASLTGVPPLSKGTQAGLLDNGAGTIVANILYRAYKDPNSVNARGEIFNLLCSRPM